MDEIGLFFACPNHNHQDNFILLANIGGVYYDMGEYTSALDYHTKSLEMNKAIYGRDCNHPNIANSYSNIGNTYEGLGEYASALD